MRPQRLHDVAFAGPSGDSASWVEEDVGSGEGSSGTDEDCDCELSCKVYRSSSGRSKTVTCQWAAREHVDRMRIMARHTVQRAL